MQWYWIPHTKPGYIATGDVTVFVACNPPEACLASRQSSYENRPRDPTSNPFCAKGYVGLTCESCLRKISDPEGIGYYRFNVGCAQCPSNSILIVMGYVGSLVGFLLLVYLILRITGVIQKIVNLFMRCYEGLVVDLRLVDMSVTLIQTLASYRWIDLKWTPTVKRVVETARRR